MAFQCAPRPHPDSIVRKAFGEFGGLAGSMSEMEFVEFCEVSRSVCAESAKRIFASVVKRPDNGMSFQEFGDGLDLLIGLDKSNSGKSVEIINTYTKETRHHSQAVMRESSKTIRKSRQLSAPRALRESRSIQRSLHANVLGETSQAPQERFAEDSKSLLALKTASFAKKQHSASTVSTRDPESDCSEVSCVSYTRCVTPTSTRCITPDPPICSLAKQSRATYEDNKSLLALVAFKQECASSASTQDPGSDCSECSLPSYTRRVTPKSSRCITPERASRFTPEPVPRVFANQCRETRGGLVYFDYYRK